jgi:hypothetical protein
MSRKRPSLRPFAGLTAVIAVVAVVALMGSGSALGDINGCPANGTGNPQADPQVAAAFSIAGTTATYTLDTTDESSSGGIPGLIEYCVYSGTQPDSVTTIAVGANGAAWTDPSGFNNFSFQRPDGDPSNIPFDGTTGIVVGTADWSAGVPATQTILLHINDPDVCGSLYGGNPLTCFVLPGNQERHEAGAPTVSKDALPSFDRKYTWQITKDACKHGTNCVQKVDQVGGTVTFDYTIKVSHGSGSDSNWQVGGTITVSNQNADDVTGVDLSDSVDNGGLCVVTGGTGLTVPGLGTTTASYNCTYTSAPDPSAGTNTVTATWPEQILLPSGHHLAGGSAQGTADFDFGTTTPSTTDECVHVTDPNSPNPPLPADVCVGDSNPTTFNYSKTITVPQFDCTSVDNTATFTTNDTGATGSASQTVTVCGPAKTGALTMGFWQNKNGQGIITSYCNVPSVGALRTFLLNYPPFQDLTATTCSGIATYVSNVIKAASAKGAAMNAMLKAQMLATALDVYFSDPALGGNKIGAPAPLGGVAVDLTVICKMIDSSSGSATCSGTFYDTSSAFGGATCPNTTVLALLSFAGSQSNAGGSVWYGQVKLTQEKAKNTFDAINNQVVFKC